MDTVLWPGLPLLLLLAAANTAPIVLKRVLGTRWNAAIDGGKLFPDGRPWLGASKTWRGLAGAIVVTALLAPVLGLGVVDGALLGALAMAGDAMSSFVKRRLGIRSSGRAFGLDQVPEALLPLLVLRDALGIDAARIVAVALAFLLLEVPGAWLSWRAGLRDEPY